MKISKLVILFFCGQCFAGGDWHLIVENKTNTPYRINQDCIQPKDRSYCWYSNDFDNPITINPHDTATINSELKATITSCHSGAKSQDTNINGDADNGKDENKSKWLMEQWFYTFNLYKDDGTGLKENNLITLRYRYAEKLVSLHSYDKEYYASVVILDSNGKTIQEPRINSNSCNMVASGFHGSTPVTSHLIIEPDGSIHAETKCN